MKAPAVPELPSQNCRARKFKTIFSASIYLYILSQPRKEDIRTGAQRHRAKKKKEYKAR